jgi:DNA-binding LacI/PurR family transcriptional regulator
VVRRPPTLDEVARAAGVGRGTASRVLNDSPHVSPAAVRAVTSAVEALGYVPNRAARALVRRRTDAVALAVSEDGERLFSDPFFARIVRGVSGRLRRSDTQMVLTMTGGEDLDRVTEYLTDQHVDGVLLLSLHADDPLPDLLEARGVPTVCGGRPTAQHPPCVVDVANRAGAAAAVDHLLGTGRRRPVVVAGPSDMSSGHDRLAGALDAAAAAGIDPSSVPVRPGDYSEASGWAATRDLLGAGVRFDALFAASDPMAVGAVRALREAGLSVPGDVAVVGFDDAPVAAAAEPRLTTVHQPVEEMGETMVDLLLARIAGQEVPAETVLPTRLVVRESA